MILSMTGYGRGRAVWGEHGVHVEIRSHNGRGRELRFRLPAELAAVEGALREQAQAVIARGRVEIAIRWEGPAPTAARFAVNAANAGALLAAWRTLRAELGLSGDPTAGELLRLPGVIEPVSGGELDLVSLTRAVAEALAVALDEHRAARAREGSQLAADLRDRAATIGRLVDEIRARADGAPERLQRQLRQRIEQLLGEPVVDEARLAQELALQATRADVSEELVRLDAHLARLAQLLAPEAREIGQGIDFLVQELRREVNTLTVKCADPEVDARALVIKQELERLREQAANLE